MKEILIAGIWILIMLSNASAQDTPKFPVETIDTTIINLRGLQEQVKMLTEECNWSERVGEKIDVFWLQNKTGNFFGYSYEYFMNCDNVRLIYWYNNPGGTGRPVDFMIENLEDESRFVVEKKRHLKNQKKYKHLLKKRELASKETKTEKNENQRKALTTIEAATEYVSNNFKNPEETLWIADSLNDNVGMNMAIIVDKILKAGYMPEGFDQEEGYRIYKYKKLK